MDHFWIETWLTVEITLLDCQTHYHNVEYQHHVIYQWLPSLGGVKNKLKGIFIQGHVEIDYQRH